MKAVVVLSGGQDSATCLALAIQRYGADEVAAITFAYGQRHSVEVKYAKCLVKRIPEVLRGSNDVLAPDRTAAALRGRNDVLAPNRTAAALRGSNDVLAPNRTAAALRGSFVPPVLHKIIHLDFYRDLTTNALLDPALEIRRNSNSKLQLNPPNTVVEGRNAVFLQLASVWAKTLGATVVYTGVSEADFSGYPDCREDFIKAQGKAIRLALDYPIRIVTPFMRMTKAEEWALADRLGILEVIRNETVTCYNGIPGKGCGKCPACKLRNRGLAEYMKRLRQESRR